MTAAPGLTGLGGLRPPGFTAPMPKMPGMMPGLMYANMAAAAAMTLASMGQDDSSDESESDEEKDEVPDPFDKDLLARLAKRAAEEPELPAPPQPSLSLDAANVAAVSSANLIASVPSLVPMAIP